MILVLGNVVIAPEHLDSALEISQAHVRRSRTEPGCLLHGVHRDTEEPQRLVFVEKWQDRAALARHFQVPASADFVRQITALAVAEPPEIEIYEASAVAFGS